MRVSSGWVLGTRANWQNTAGAGGIPPTTNRRALAAGPGWAQTAVASRVVSRDTTPQSGSCGGGPSRSALLRQHAVEAEPAAAGHEQEQRPAHHGKVLGEVIVLVLLRRRRILPVAMRQRGGDDEVDEGEQAQVAGREPENEGDPDQDFRRRGDPRPEPRIGHLEVGEIADKAGDV